MGRIGRIVVPDTSIRPKYGRLTVIGEPVRVTGGNGAETWSVPCRCDCGAEKLAKWCRLRDGNTTSCGCYRKEVTTAFNHRKFDEDAMSKQRTWKIWRGMIHRCTDPTHTGFADYGGRGIGVCDEWRNSYPAFRDWAMNAGYGDDLTIERIDVNGSYCPENCTWIPAAHQALNKRTSRRYEYQGETKLLQEWFADPRCNAPSLNSLYQRISYGWSVERAITAPPQKKNRGPRKTPTG